MLQEHLTALNARLGEEAVAWLLATDVPTIKSWAEGAPASEAIAAVTELATRIADKAWKQDAPEFAVGQFLSVPSPEGLAIGAELRLLAGGSIEAPPSDDPIARPLLQLAAQVAGALLLRPQRDFRHFLGAPSMAAGASHPLASEAAAVALKELPINEWTSDRTILNRSTGAGSPFTTQLLASQLLTDAGNRWLLRREWPAVDALFDSVAETVQAFRRVANGRTAYVPALLGFGGIRLPEHAEVELPWGTLRPLRPRERERIPETAVETVLEAKVPFRVSVTDVDTPGWPPALTEAIMAPISIARDVAFSLLLAGPEPYPDTMTLAFRLTTDPVQGIASVASSREDLRGMLELSDSDTQRLARVSAAYEQNHHKSLDVAVRRAVSAAGRSDFSDAFIDAIIGWDNLFGSAAGESQLRISASFAHLLGKDPSDRQRLASEVKADYELRSRLVHGDISELPVDQASEADRRALDLLLRALRVLYTDRRDLLQMNSGQRSQALLLGAPRGHSAPTEA